LTGPRAKKFEVTVSGESSSLHYPIAAARVWRLWSRPAYRRQCCRHRAAVRPKVAIGGYDAVTAAPGSHRVIFENALVRVLEVTMPPPGKTEPMHHHHWPGFFLDWDTGGKSPHIRYHQPADKVRDVQSSDTPTHPGRWSVHWMKPEPMHAIKTVESYYSPNDRSSVRVEIKVRP
jgi:hypothetical protein